MQRHCSLVGAPVHQLVPKLLSCVAALYLTLYPKRYSDAFSSEELGRLVSQHDSKQFHSYFISGQRTAAGSAGGAAGVAAGAGPVAAVAVLLHHVRRQPHQPRTSSLLAARGAS